MHIHDRWRSRARWWRLAMVMAGVCGAALACTCGSLANLVNIPATAGAAVNDVEPTLAAQMTAFAPTFAAEATRLMQEGTALAPQYEASQTAVILTVDAAALPASPTDTPLPPSGGGSAPTATLPPAPPSGGGSAQQGFTGGDENDTTQILPIGIGQTQRGTISGVFDAHNWLFEGQSGQTVTIEVVGVGSTDPSATLIDPNGTVVARSDQTDSGGSEHITATLQLSGTYTVRVNVYVPGDYTITVR